MGLRVSESVVRDHLGLPDPGDDERILQAPQGAPPPPTAPVEDLQEMVARSTFTARLAGNTGARIG